MVDQDVVEDQSVIVAAYKSSAERGQSHDDGREKDSQNEDGGAVSEWSWGVGVNRHVDRQKPRFVTGQYLSAVGQAVSATPVVVNCSVVVSRVSAWVAGGMTVLAGPLKPICSCDPPRADYLARTAAGFRSWQVAGIRRRWTCTSRAPAGGWPTSLGTIRVALHRPTIGHAKSA